jgi:protein-L-isoaspartate(D-aspartate) O-methyltransferase
MNRERHHLGIGMTSQRTRERLIQRLRERGIADARVLEAMRNLPRHIFVDEALATRAYEDTALPIGNGQTISQPATVARMTEVLLSGVPCRKVLEVGTGSGYQTALLARLVDEVFSVERIDQLLRRARERFRELGITNVRLRHGDGYAGWPEHAPYDGILVTAAPTELPPGLLQQLADGGRMIIPVGQQGAQRLLRIVRRGDVFEQEELDMVSFVPLLEGAQS